MMEPTDHPVAPNSWAGLVETSMRCVSPSRTTMTDTGEWRTSLCATEPMTRPPTNPWVRPPTTMVVAR
jgi:hypothetical protein